MDTRGEGDRRVLGRGKVILLGEHAVVYGTPALAAGIERGVWASATPADTTTLSIAPWDVTLRPGGNEDLARALTAVWEAHPVSLPPLRIRADVALPAGAGLGCSAALGVAVIRAIDAAVDHAASDAEVAERGLVWEHVFHGNPSGVDNTMAAHGGVAVFQRGEPLAPVQVRHPLTLVVGNSGHASSTKEMVAEVARQRGRDVARFDKTLESITILVRNARLAIQDGDLAALGQLMDLNHTLMSGLMVSTTALEEMCAAARDAGARGAKLTGAGGGGCMIALTEPAGAENVREAIVKTGHDAFVTEVGG
ncbi:MAG: mevalonate kinase [Sandaracinaceae bacterium]